jgi:putative heme-binding domain-containing protein
MRPHALNPSRGSRTLSRSIDMASVLFRSVGATLLILAAQQGVAYEQPAEVAPPGGWKLADLTVAMNSLKGQSYTNGKRLFEQANCTACHRQENTGHEFGPDLTKLDPRFQPLDILRDILEPSRRIADAKYDLWSFETDIGRVVTGLILRETDETVQVMEKPVTVAPSVVLRKSEIEQRTMSLTSTMPQGMLDKLTRREIADLVAYVAARGDPSSPFVEPLVDPLPASSGNDAAKGPNDDLAFFETKIRPVLVEHCYTCHSGQAKKIEGSLRLDHRQGWVKGGESGPAIVPGKPDESLLVSALRYDGLEMPPEKKLPPDVSADFATWIRRGAVDPRTEEPKASTGQTPWAEKLAARRKWWSLQPPQAPKVPEADHPQWSNHPVDQFLLAKMEAAGLRPSPKAEKRTLLRRLYFDLIGLPPTYEDVQEFKSDKSPDAWPRAIDRLLARPEYGQRWGRHWLDVARYADTVEQSTDGERRIPFAYTYRDYVIDAFNTDKPFDRFILEQVAADRLPTADKPDLRALGFLTIGRRFRGNADAPQLVIDDRIDVIGRGLLGMTLACARCHDHKFDAVGAADYYALYGIIGSVEEPLDLPAVNEPPHSPELDKYLASRTAILQEYEAYVDRCRTEANRKFREWSGDYLKYVVRSSPGHRTTEGFIPLDTPRGYLASGSPPRWRSLLAQSQDAGEPFFKLWHELFALDRREFAAHAQPILQQLRARPESYNSLVAAAFADAQPESMLDVAEIYGQVITNTLAGKDAAGRAVVALVFGPDSPVEVSRAEVAEDLLKSLTDRQFVERSESVAAEAIRFKLLRLEATGPVQRAMAVRASAVPLEPRVLVRGDPQQLGPAVPRRFLHALSKVDNSEYRDDGRLQLARAIASPKNPLTARVIVNRVWQHHFGEGIVDTPDDFGFMGGKPSHAELLDHLACWFVEHGWSIKALHRYLLTTAAWQQANTIQPRAVEVDFRNRLLSRMAPRRLEFEPLRDALLQVAGRLDARLGGQSRPLDDTNVRRAVYGYTDRFRVPALMRAFDVANPDTSISRRSDTTVAQQALYLLNSPFVLAQAVAVTQQIEQQTSKAPAADDQIRLAYHVVFGRDPVPAEFATAREYLLQPADASERTPSQRTPLLLIFVHALLSSNEFAYVD